ncbi:transcriptional repressor p66 alpha-like [Sardina pilchardus]|uniref:transcriptional repressor p66 alpha-like n=1 Tax=Sardina pilchardus TaxID=27697 RepID=UPI002E115E2F
MDIRNYFTGARDSNDGDLAKDYHSIHKHLRRSLHSIPPPPPRASGLDFLPDVGNQQFTYLIGLEVIVQKRLTETQNVSPKQRKHKAKGALRKETDPPRYDPYTCDQCLTDFTCQWWCVTISTARGGQLCDQCKTSKDKKAIVEAHTSKMEDAFEHAKQMKLEAKQRLLQGRLQAMQLPQCSQRI